MQKGKNNMKHLLVHYANIVGSLHLVECDDEKLRAYSPSGELVAYIAKDGAGNLKCRAKEFGLKLAHTLSPLPKDGRLYKWSKEGHAIKDEKYSERLEARKQFLDVDGLLLSCEELEKKGLKFDEDQKLKPSKA